MSRALRITVLTTIGVAALAGYLVHAISFSFLQDDAFIFLRYASHLVDGHGLVWNIGEPVEGYTSLTWVLLLGALLSASVAVETWVHLVTVGLGIGTLGLAFHLGWRWTRYCWAGLFVIVLLATDRTFAVWSTSGMETRLYGFLAMTLLATTHRSLTSPTTQWHSLLLGFVMLLISLTRPEGVLLAGFTLLFLFIRGAGQRQDVLLGGGVWLGGVVGHLLWRLDYYGRWLPNTFYVKVNGVDPSFGGRYLGDFLGSFPMLAMLWAVAIGVALARMGADRFRTYLAGLLLLYLAYLLLVGGDFMEFRMLDVLLPPAYLLIVGSLSEFWKRSMGSGWRIAVGMVVVAIGVGNIYGDITFDDHKHHVMTRDSMSTQTTDYWVVIGKWFHRHARPGESIATTAAGAIPYYSKLRAVDMLGLNDQYVASLPPQRNQMVGHRKLAPPAYLRSQRITYVLGHPRILRDPHQWHPRPDRFLVEIENSDPNVLAGSDFYLLVLTTGRSDTLISSLRARGARVFP